MKLKNRVGSLIIILLNIMLLFFVIGFYRSNYRRVLYGYDQSTFKNITSIQYHETKETYGQGDGRSIKSSYITYVYPDKLRIESIGSAKKIEIYNHNRYLYYDNDSNQTKLKECFPPDKPYISEIEKKMVNILNKGEYEFFGYEEKDNKRMEVIGVKSRLDGHVYMHKLWISDFNGVVLPVKEEYFIDNSVVSKTTYAYQKVNEAINPNLFDETSLPNHNVVNDGYLPKFVDSIEEAKKYLDFKPIILKVPPQGFIVSELSVVPPLRKPTFNCIYFKEGHRIYLNEKSQGEAFVQNGTLGSKPCSYERKNGKIIIKWNQDNIFLTLSGDEEMLTEIIDIAEIISGGNLVKTQHIN